MIRGLFATCMFGLLAAVAPKQEQSASRGVELLQRVQVLMDDEEYEEAVLLLVQVVQTLPANSEEALVARNLIVELVQRIYGGDHVDVAISLNRLALWGFANANIVLLRERVCLVAPSHHAGPASAGSPRSREAGSRLPGFLRCPSP